MTTTAHHGEEKSTQGTRRGGAGIAIAWLPVRPLKKKQKKTRPSWERSSPRSAPLFRLFLFPPTHSPYIPRHSETWHRFPPPRPIDPFTKKVAEKCHGRRREKRKTASRPATTAVGRKRQYEPPTLVHWLIDPLVFWVRGT